MEIKDIQVGLTYTSGDDTIEVLRKVNNIWGHPIFVCSVEGPSRVIGEKVNIPASYDSYFVSTWKEADTINQY